MLLRGKKKNEDVELELSNEEIIKKLVEQETRLKSLETVTNKTNNNYNSTEELDWDTLCNQLLNNEIEL